MYTGEWQWPGGDLNDHLPQLPHSINKINIVQKLEPRDIFLQFSSFRGILFFKNSSKSLQFLVCQCLSLAIVSVSYVLVIMVWKIHAYESREGDVHKPSSWKL